MKTIEVRIYCKLTVTDNFDVAWATQRVHTGARMGIEGEELIRRAVEVVEIESVNVTLVPPGPPTKPVSKE